MTDRLLQEFAILTTLERYFCAMDARNGAALADVFTADVVARYHAGTAGEFTHTGRDLVLDYLVGNLAAFDHRTHDRANTIITFTDSGAHAVTHAVAVIVKEGTVSTRGLRYEDDLVVTGSRWAIARRVHTPLWQFDAALSPPLVPALALAAARKA